MGRASAPLNHVNLQSILREAGAYSLRRLALPHFLLQCVASLDVFRRFSSERDKQNRRESERHHQSLFSTVDPLFFCHAFLPGGLRDLVSNVCRDHDLLPRSTELAYPNAPRIPTACRTNGPG